MKLLVGVDDVVDQLQAVVVAFLVLDLLVPVPVHVAVVGEYCGKYHDQNLAYQVDYVTGHCPPKLLGHVALLIPDRIDRIINTPPQP